MPKESWERDESDLQRLIDDQVEEDSRLEYKAAESLGLSDGKKNEISKDVSAFANSAGGTIIYGIRESSGTPPHRPEGLDGIDPAQLSKEWLDQVINSRIRERILGVLINPVNLSGQQSGKVAYVVQIPQSTTAHQASDNRYYRRFIR